MPAIHSSRVPACHGSCQPLDRGDRAHIDDHPAAPPPHTKELCMSRKSTPGRVSLAVGVALVALFAAGCSKGTAGADTSVKDATTDTAKQALDAAFKGAPGTPPTVPTKPKAGVNLWVVSC